MDPARSGRGIYFSHFYDLTQSSQRIADRDADPVAAAAPLASPQRADARFWYNRTLAASLLDAGAHRCAHTCARSSIWGRGVVVWWGVHRVRSSAGATSEKEVVGTRNSGSPGTVPQGFNVSGTVCDCIGRRRWPDAAPFPCCPTHTRHVPPHLRRFTPPVMLGFLRQLPGLHFAGGKSATLTLIARRGVDRAGTRQWRRGCDSKGGCVLRGRRVLPGAAAAGTQFTCQMDRRGGLWRTPPDSGALDHTRAASHVQSPAVTVYLTWHLPDPTGNVANFVETEEVVTTPAGDLASYVQVRGSIPLLWTQVRVDGGRGGGGAAMANEQGVVSGAAVRYCVAALWQAVCGDSERWQLKSRFATTTKLAAFSMHHLHPACQPPAAQHQVQAHHRHRGAGPVGGGV